MVIDRYTPRYGNTTDCRILLINTFLQQYRRSLTIAVYAGCTWGSTNAIID